MSLAHAKRYAHTFFEDSSDHQILENVYNDLQALSQILKQSELLQDLLESSHIDAAKWDLVLETLTKSGLHKRTVLYLEFLKDKGRLFLLKDVVSVFEKIYLKSQNIAKASVVSAFALNDNQKSNIQKSLKDKLQNNIEAVFSEDSSLIGGMVIHLEDKILDYSVSSSLQRFAEKCLSSSG